MKHLFSRFHKIVYTKGLNTLYCCLGLTISKNLAEKLNGDLVVD
jgi:C4-dicarboxylate-specific signal transduction histidine kinase